MKIWSISDPEDHRYGRAETVGAFRSPQPKYGRGERESPLIIKWDLQARVAGDFTFPCVVSDIMVKRTIGEELLRAGFKGFQLGSVEIQTKQKTIRLKSPAGLIHEFVEILITKVVPLRETKSTFSTEISMGKTYYRMPGIAYATATNYGRIKEPLNRVLVPREKGKGFFVQENLLSGCDVFRVSEFEGRTLCTDRFREFVKEHGYTNVSFLEAGDVVSA